MTFTIGRVTSTLLALVVLIGASPDTSARRHFGKDQPFALTDLPLGKLRARLEQLPAEKRLRAMTWLHRFNFPTADVPQLRSDLDGGVLYVDAAPLPDAVTTTPVVGAASVATTIPTTSAFALHSRAGATNVVYLDFDGHTLTGTAWNASTGRAALNAVAYDTDGVLGSFSTGELNNIINIWRRISEDFAPFNVDVTTQLPASFGPRIARVLITRDSDSTGVAMPYQGAGGVAYINVFGASNYSYYQPALVYYNRLGNGREDFVAEAASHEMGHNLGLSHDATATSSYYGGHGAGATSWGPIMGTGYNRAVSQWSRGEYAGANNFEDDVAIVTSKVGLRSDDYGNTNATASPLIATPTGVVTSVTIDSDWSNSQPQNKGVLASQSDIDVFYFDASAGAVNLTATPHRMPANTAGGNLDVELRLYSQGGALLGTASPNGATSANLVASVPAGRMYLQVSGVGDPTVPYSDYGSLGQYNLSGTLPVAVANTTPPSPNPMSFEAAPTATGPTAIALRATTAIDDAGSAVQYRVECTAGGVGCVTSAWQSARDFTATGLAANTLYRYRVRARDAFGNETNPSSEASVTTPSPVVVQVNRAPLAVADAASVNPFKVVTLNVLANDSDPDGDPLTITGVTKAARGGVSVVNNQLRYRAGSKTGTDVISYSIADGRGGVATATVVVTIRAR